MAKTKVLLGMSGGVDSSVSAVLLQQQGYEVIGAFMHNWSDCDWRADRRDALRVAAQLGIEFQTFDFEKEYREKIYEYMIKEYQAGRTPNPDVLCNKYMKFDLFLKQADELGCEFVATGHYARIDRDTDDKCHLLAGIDNNKDQTYFLCQLEQDQLQRILFPIGHLEKSEVRNLARTHSLSVADKKDSQGICFVGKVSIQQFLEARITPHAGNIVTTAGEVIGQHQGFEFYTIGQREGLGVGGGTPYYVVERKPETNEVVVAVGSDDPALYKTTLQATNLTETITGNFAKYQHQSILARIRYRQPLAHCQFEFSSTDKQQLKVSFDVPQRAVTPGQFIAFYVGDELIGSGVIE